MEKNKYLCTDVATDPNKEAAQNKCFNYTFNLFHIKKYFECLYIYDFETNNSNLCSNKK